MRRAVQDGALLEFFRYHGAWAPGVRLFRSIGFRAKALVIAFTFAVPLAWLAYSYYGDKAGAIEFSAKERVGLVYADKAVPLLHLLQQQRLRAVQQAAGAAGADPAALDADVQRAFDALAGVEKAHGAELGTAAAFGKLEAARGAFQQAAGGVDATFERHGARLQAVLDLLGMATDGSNLTLDPDIDTYYLMDTALFRLPAMVDSAGQLQALGAAVLAKGSATPAQLRRVTEQSVLLAANLAAVQAGLDKAVAYNGALKTTVDAAAGAGSVAALLKGVESALLHPDGVKGDAATHVAAAQAALEALAVLDQHARGELDRLIAERVQRMVSQRAVTTVVLLASLLLAAYFFAAFRKVLAGGLREVAFHIDAMRDGNLTTNQRAWGADEPAQLMGTLVQMQGSLRRIVSQVRGASDSLVHASGEIASGSQDLSQRTEESAAHLQEAASTMGGIAEASGRNAATVGEASRLAQDSAEVARRGGEVITKVIQTMQGIHQSSARIGEIIATIDGIAFQTNILALNAAVEAARAGDHGRGFAVVAGEVRTLAQRSSIAAREIKTLVGSSVAEAEAGNRVVEDAGTTIADIVATARRLESMLVEVAGGARDQAGSVGHAGQTLRELDGATQQNAALVEETAAAASTLREHAHALAASVSQFRLPAAA